MTLELSEKMLCPLPLSYLFKKDGYKNEMTDSVGFVLQLLQKEVELDETGVVKPGNEDMVYRILYSLCLEIFIIKIYVNRGIRM